MHMNNFVLIEFDRSKKWYFLVNAYEDINHCLIYLFSYEFHFRSKKWKYDVGINNLVKRWYIKDIYKYDKNSFMYLQNDIKYS